MGLQCGIVGLPNVGKSTLFNSLSSAKAQAANFPFCTIEPNLGVMPVPDHRLDTLVSIDHPARVVPATVEIVDIAGLVKGASKGEGLGNKFLANIRETDALLHILRCFDDDNVVHVDGSVNPLRDKEIIDSELQIKDLESVETRLTKVTKVARLSSDRQGKMEVALLERCKTHLEEGKSLRTLEVSDEEAILLHSFQLLTSKPVLYVCNVDENSAVSGNAYTEKVAAALTAEKAQMLIVATQLESEIAELDDAEERALFLKEAGLQEAGVNRVIKAAYRLLGLETFFTTGADETRAWTFRHGTKAPAAAGLIHSDIEKGFIRAEIIQYADYIALGSEAACREAGKIAIEGKEYTMRDGDIVHFRFNV